MAQVPGARIVAGTIERQADRLVYSFDLGYPDNGMAEHVQIDATSGEIVLVEYCIKLDERGQYQVNAAPELVAQVEITFADARAKALAEFRNGQLARSALRVQGSGHLYVLDIEVTGDSVAKRILIDAYSGKLVSIMP
jgi:uncharacterized membrane protein YkoI